MPRRPPNFTGLWHQPPLPPLRPLRAVDEASVRRELDDLAAWLRVQIPCPQARRELVRTV